MAQENKNQKSKGAVAQSAAVMPLIALCGILVSACVAFGNPFLWMTDAQAQARNSDEQTTVVDESNESDEPAGVSDALANMKPISEYKAISQSNDEQRVINLELASEAINEIEIGPGETFSFNDVVGDTENDERYQVAPIVYGSDMAYSRGGGICQVSTALYIAALKADMEIVERHPHSLVTDYAPIGLDATLVYGSMDLKIKNTSDYPIKIVAIAKGQTVTVELLGRPLENGVTIDATSKILELDTESHQQEDGIDDTYYVVESYRVYYKDDVVTESVLLCTDTYEVHQSSTVTLTEGSFDPTK